MFHVKHIESSQETSRQNGRIRTSDFHASLRSLRQHCQVVADEECVFLYYRCFTWNTGTSRAMGLTSMMLEGSKV